MKRSDILGLSFYDRSKLPFSGSENGTRYMIEKITEDDKKRLKAYIWPEPFSFKNTDEDKKISRIFDFSEDGLSDIANWINENLK